MGCFIEVDEIVRWVNLSIEVEDEGFSIYGVDEVVELNVLECWFVMFEFVGV